jgi:hypothetical protein
MSKFAFAAIIGFALALCMAAALSLASGALLSKPRLTAVLNQAFADGSLTDDSHTWIECAVLNMQVLRHDSVVLNAIDTRWNGGGCGALKSIMNEPSPSYRTYDNYPFGARHLQAVFLSVMSLHATIIVFRVLSYGSLLMMLIFAWRNRPRAAALLLPVFAVLALAFDQPEWGYPNSNLSPAFFVGYFSLAFFLAAESLFDRAPARLGFFCFSGTLIAFFDNLHGPLPVLLSLTIVVDQWFYGTKRSKIEVALNAVMIFACFVAAFVALTAVRMALLRLAGVGFGWVDFMGALGARLADTAPAVDSTAIVHVSIRDIVAGLWTRRSEIFGEQTSSTLLLIVGPVAWTIAAARLLYLRQLPPPIVSLAIAGAGILLWYPLFPNHSVIHPWLMVRMLSLPVAYGLSAVGLLFLPASEAFQPATAALARHDFRT